MERTPKIFDSEYRFCLILWENEPIRSTEFAKLCTAQLVWSKNTTFSVIKRLSERGVMKNEDTIVTSLISKDEAQLGKLDSVIDGRFSVSIPSFLAAFAKRQKLSEKDMVEIEKLLNGGDE